LVVSFSGGGKPATADLTLRAPAARKGSDG
jgi:hypothetical protein